MASAIGFIRTFIIIILRIRNTWFKLMRNMKGVIPLAITSSEGEMATLVIDVVWPLYIEGFKII